MLIKGTAVIGRKKALAKEFGEERLKAFLDGQDPCFQNVLSSTWFEIDKFLALQEAIVAHFFDGNEQALFKYGEESANWALREGPYSTFAATKNVRRFAEEVIPLVWSAYYSEGEARAQVDENIVHYRIGHLPKMHVHFELVVMGWMKKALEIVTAHPVIAKKIQGAVPGATEIYYQFFITT
jgi:hypothetical protein